MPRGANTSWQPHLPTSLMHYTRFLEFVKTRRLHRPKQFRGCCLVLHVKLRKTRTFIVLAMGLKPRAFRVCHSIKIVYFHVLDQWILGMEVSGEQSENF